MLKHRTRVTSLSRENTRAFAANRQLSNPIGRAVWGVEARPASVEALLIQPGQVQLTPVCAAFFCFCLNVSRKLLYGIVRRVDGVQQPLHQRRQVHDSSKSDRVCHWIRNHSLVQPIPNGPGFKITCPSKVRLIVYVDRSQFMTTTNATMTKPRIVHCPISTRSVRYRNRCGERPCKMSKSRAGPRTSSCSAPTASTCGTGDSYMMVIGV